MKGPKKAETSLKAEQRDPWDCDEIMRTISRSNNRQDQFGLKVSTEWKRLKISVKEKQITADSMNHQCLRFI